MKKKLHFKEALPYFIAVVMLTFLMVCVVIGYDVMLRYPNEFSFLSDTFTIGDFTFTYAEFALIFGLCVSTFIVIGFVYRLWCFLVKKIIKCIY